jgi:hypothetical protein
LEAFPDATFVYLVRHPYDAIPSLMSLFHAIWSLYAPEIAKASPKSYAVAQMGFEYYRLVLEPPTEEIRERVVHSQRSLGKTRCGCTQEPQSSQRQTRDQPPRAEDGGAAADRAGGPAPQLIVAQRFRPVRSN